MLERVEHAQATHLPVATPGARQEVVAGIGGPSVHTASLTCDHMPLNHSGMMAVGELDGLELGRDGLHALEVLDRGLIELLDEVPGLSTLVAAEVPRRS